jgi:SAM-dependent methyltransferase
MRLEAVMLLCLVRWFLDMSVQLWYFATGACSVCGCHGRPYFSRLISSELATQWGLSWWQRLFFDIREGCRCRKCGASIRYQGMAWSVIAWITRESTPTRNECLQTATELVLYSKARVCVVNSCGALDDFLNRTEQFAKSEYGSTNPGVRSEDLRKLSYASDIFDLVLLSDVLEHVNHLDDALSEIWRILRATGVCILTVPVLWRRQETRMRDSSMPSSFHGIGRHSDYLVHWEFGRDVCDILVNAHFDVSCVPYRGARGFAAIFCLKCT